MRPGNEAARATTNERLGMNYAFYVSVTGTIVRFASLRLVARSGFAHPFDAIMTRHARWWIAPDAAVETVRPLRSDRPRERDRAGGGSRGG